MNGKIIDLTYYFHFEAQYINIIAYRKTTSTITR